MGAVITVLSGAAAQREFRVEAEVLRIGSDPACDIVLPDAGLAGHVATLESRDGGYVVYNRGGGVLRLDNVVLPARSFKPWQAGQTLKVSEAVALKLDIRAEAPAARRAAVAPASGNSVVGSAKETAASAPAPSPAKRMQQYVILGVIGVVGVIVLFMDSPTPGAAKPAAGARNKFTELMAECQREYRGNDLIQQVVQEARIAALRNDVARARVLYGQVLETLLPRRDASGNFPRALEQQIWNFASEELDKVHERRGATTNLD
ncbi:hypothetical protein AYO44_10335 [Planctomycetaceae bacterium SCGC AG-212-F19]|nr:hypothetical protein AYO44_10335 [Planctomycetaceae bacterium SCGC AG-212-F19]